jgi:hypothetical protein
MHVEIVSGNCDVRSRSFTTKDGGQRQVHEQPAFLHVPGSPYPLPFSLSLDTAAAAYGPGTYVFAPESIRTNQYGQLEFNRFGMRLIRANLGESQKPKAVNS